MVFLLIPARAQEKNRPDIFIAPLVELIGFSGKGLAFGGGFALGAENSGYALGLRILYATEGDSINTTELNVFVRFYFFERDQHTGIFLQLNGGSAHYSRDEDDAGSVSAGVSVGWRFPFKKIFFIEPAVRIGYPYMAGVGGAGVYRF